MMRIPFFILASVIAMRTASTVHAEPILDIPFATIGDKELSLDLFLPENTEDPALVVWIHGGGWRGGDRKQAKPDYFLEKGLAVASIEYRLSSEAIFPAQIHDCKAAIRWLRAHADEYGYDASKIVALGTSAGGHLALLLGVSGGDHRLEGTIGDHLERSSSVQAIIDFYGASDFVHRSTNQPHKTEKPEGPVYGLLGGPVKENIQQARFASPIHYVDPSDPPLWMIHGEQDTTVLLDQSERMRDAYLKAGLEVNLEIIEGAGHGGAGFHDDKEAVFQRIEWAKNVLEILKD